MNEVVMLTSLPLIPMLHELILCENVITISI